MACKNCVNACCLPKLEKPELTLGENCIVKPGVYHNVTVEIDRNCKVVRLEQADRTKVTGCDTCE